MAPLSLSLPPPGHSPPSLPPALSSLLCFPPKLSLYPPALSELIFLTHLGRLVITILSRNSFHFITPGEKYWAPGGGVGAVCHFSPVSVSGGAGGGGTSMLGPLTGRRSVCEREQNPPLLFPAQSPCPTAPSISRGPLPFSVLTHHPHFEGFLELAEPISTHCSV